MNTKANRQTLLTREISAGIGALLAAVVALFAATPASSTTYQMMSDQELTRQADLVVEGSVLTAYGVDANPFPSTEYVVLASRVLKGAVEDSTIVVRVIGGTSPSGERFEVVGAPRLEEGSEVVLFLNANRDGSYGLLHLALGAFQRIDRAGERVAVRGIDAALAASAKAARVRDYDRFVDWVEGTVRGERRAADYFVEGGAGREFSAAYTLEEYEGLNVRWFDFDGGKVVNWKISGSNDPADAKALEAALNAWNAVNGPDVKMAYAGTTQSTSGFQTSDMQNTVLFGDPNDLIAGRFDCAKGGVAALGGWWSDEVMNLYEGRNYYRIIEGDVVVNDGVECYLDGRAERLASLFTHEIGHALGLGHSCGDEIAGACDTERKKEAIMNARSENDHRGASLNRDDREALAALYGELIEEELAAPTDLKARLKAGNKLKLTWTDNSESEEAFEIYLNAGKGWELWKTVGSNKNRLKTRLDVEAKGKVLFRARAIADVDESPFSNNAKVRLR